MRIGFLLKESFSGYKRFKISFILSIFTSFVALSLLGVFAFLFLNAKLLVDEVKNKVEIEAFLSDTLSDVHITRIREYLSSLDGIQKVEFISRQMAEKRFLDETGIDFKEILTFNPLPASITLELKSEFVNKDFLNSLDKELKSIVGITDVIYNQQFLDLIEHRASTFQNILIVVFSLVMLSTVILIYNTIRLALVNKTDVINTMRLVGATNTFIKLPFIIEGIFQGTIGGLLSAIALFVFNYFFNKFLSVESLIDLKNLTLMALTLVLLGGIFGFLGSILSIKKFFKLSVFPK
ncbi:MAG: ABC transporter permease [Ignavibacteria bacterium]|nr:ABC transporter permease [Ignavibacteria bacterium]